MWRLKHWQNEADGEAKELAPTESEGQMILEPSQDMATTQGHVQQEEKQQKDLHSWE